MEISQRQQEAISALRNKLLAIARIDDIRDDLFSSMVNDWILNAVPNEPGFENALQMKELVEEMFPGVQIDNQQATELLDAWLEFVGDFYAVNGGKRRKHSKKTRKHKKRSKKTRRA